MKNIRLHKLSYQNGQVPILTTFQAEDDNNPNLNASISIAGILLSKGGKMISYLNQNNGAIIFDPDNLLSLRKDDGAVSLIGKDQSFLQGIDFKGHEATYDGQEGCPYQYKRAIESLGLSDKNPYVICSLKPALFLKDAGLIGHIIANELVHELDLDDIDTNDGLDNDLLNRLIGINEDELERRASDDAIIRQEMKIKNRKTHIPTEEELAFEASHVKEIMQLMNLVGEDITEREVTEAFHSFIKREKKSGLYTNPVTVDEHLPENYDRKKTAILILG